LATTIFISAENTRHSEFPGHIPSIGIHHSGVVRKRFVHILKIIFIGSNGLSFLAFSKGSWGSNNDDIFPNVEFQIAPF
jgi:hypothetical protein